MRKAILVLTIVATAALVAPLAAQGDDDDALRVRLELPVIFGDVTPECAFGTADFGISSKKKTGSGRNCIQEIDFLAECPPVSEAFLCPQTKALTTLQLRGGTIEAEVTIFEMWRCGDPCFPLEIDQRWSGTVIRATRKFRELEGGRVSGGGTFVVDPGTFEPLSLDEVLVISEGDEEADD